MAKAAFKARRVVFDGLSAWAIVWFHWCRSPIRRWGRIRLCSRYAVTVVQDFYIADSNEVGLHCDHCGQCRILHNTVLPVMWAESALTVRLMAAVRCG